MTTESKVESKTIDEVDDEEFVRCGAGLTMDALHEGKLEDVTDQDVWFEFCLSLQKYGVHMAKRTDKEWRSMERNTRQKVLTLMCSLSPLYISSIIADGLVFKREREEALEAYPDQLALSLIPHDVKAEDGEACIKVTYKNFATIRQHIQGENTADTLPKTKVSTLSEVREWLDEANEWETIANTIRVIIGIEVEVSPIFHWYGFCPICDFTFTFITPGPTGRDFVTNT